MKIRGHNEHSDGWLHRVFGQPRDEDRSEIWQDGWDMADETIEMGGMRSVFNVFPNLLEYDHIIVEQEED